MQNKSSLAYLASLANLAFTPYERIKANLKGQRMKVDRKSILTSNYHSSKLAKNSRCLINKRLSIKVHSKINLCLYKELTKTKVLRDKESKRNRYKELYSYKNKALNKTQFTIRNSKKLPFPDYLNSFTK